MSGLDGSWVMGGVEVEGEEVVGGERRVIAFV